MDQEQVVVLLSSLLYAFTCLPTYLCVDNYLVCWHRRTVVARCARNESTYGVSKPWMTYRAFWTPTKVTPNKSSPLIKPGALNAFLSCNFLTNNVWCLLTVMLLILWSHYSLHVFSLNAAKTETLEISTHWIRGILHLLLKL